VEVVLTAQQPVPTWERGPTRQPLPTDTDSIIDVIGAKHKKHKRSKDPTCLLILAGLGSTLQGFCPAEKVRTNKNAWVQFSGPFQLFFSGRKNPGLHQIQMLDFYLKNGQNAELHHFPCF
jgi:hypothetical protein